MHVVPGGVTADLIASSSLARLQHIHPGGNITGFLRRSGAAAPPQVKRDLLCDPPRE